MKNSRIIAIGDIHGCYNTLVKLILDVDYNKATDTLVLLGDYIDRGPHSYETVRFLRKLQKEAGKDKVICLRGNHEQMLIDAGGDMSPIWYMNGGVDTIISYQQNGAEPQEDIAWYMSLPLYYESKNQIFAHAGLTEPLLKDNCDRDLLWGREWIEVDGRIREKGVVFGHTPCREFVPYQTKSGDLCIDCGCVYGGMLCAAVFVGDGGADIHCVERSSKDFQ